MEKTKPEIKGDSGKTYLLKCESPGKKPVWYYSISDELPRDKNPIDSSKNPLIITSVTFKDSGYYFCYGVAGKIGFRKHFWSTTVLKVYGKCQHTCIYYKIGHTLLLVHLGDCCNIV